MTAPPRHDHRVDFADRAAFERYVRLRSAVPDKADFILGRCAGRSVLDLGCINHSAATAVALGNRWLHRRIADLASEAVGLDILAEDARELTAAGWPIEVGDAQRFDLGRTFDVVVAGDLIEHLSDIGSFLASVRRHMHERSELVLTTPNPFSFTQMLQVLVRGQVVVNPQHTMWFDPSVLHELLTRHGFDAVAFSWVESDPEFRPTTTLTKILWAADHVVSRWRPLARANYGIVAVARG